MSRRRLIWVLLGVAGLASLTTVVIWWKFPSLNSDEWRIVGEWSSSWFEPGRRFATTAGPVSRPFRVWEFRRDRSFRVWVGSVDDPDVKIPDVQGHWRVVNGRLHFEGLGRVEGGFKTIEDHVQSWQGRAVARRITGNGAEHTLRLPDPETMEITTKDGLIVTWKGRR